MSGRQRRVGESASAATHVREKWFWWTVTLAALAPMGWLAWLALTDSLGVDPVNTINNVSGRAAMITLFLSLACTPLNTIFGFRRALTVRRSLGLIAFAYASLHLLNFVGLDYGFDWNLITQDAVFDKPYILAGGLALLLLALLAITSTRGWMRRLGRNWKRLHQLVYGAGVLVVLHFLWQAKAAERWEPLMYGGVLAALLLVRVPTVRSWLVRQRAARSARVPSPRAAQAD